MLNVKFAGSVGRVEKQGRKGRVGEIRKGPIKTKANKTKRKNLNLNPLLNIQKGVNKCIIYPKEFF